MSIYVVLYYFLNLQVYTSALPNSILFYNDVSFYVVNEKLLMKTNCIILLGICLHSVDTRLFKMYNITVRTRTRDKVEYYTSGI